MDPSDKETEIILTQWKTCVEMVDSVSRRRYTMNNIFISLNLAINAATSFTWDTLIWRLPLPFAGIVFCILWLYLLHSYKQLNYAKFKVIHNIESKLPVQPFKDEEMLLDEKQDKYKRFTNLESRLPIVFIILYLGEGLGLIYLNSVV